MTFKLDKIEEQKLSEWKESIKKTYGKYGLFEYRFTPTGIGTQIKVYSQLAKIEIDLTNVDNW